MLLALMQFVITSANFHAIGRATDRRSKMLLQPPQWRGFGIGVRLRTMSLRQSRMIQGPGLRFGRDALGHGDWETSIAKLVGQTDDKTSWPKHSCIGIDNFDLGNLRVTVSRDVFDGS